MMPLWSAALLTGLVAVAVLMERQYTYLSQLGGFLRVAAILAIAACMAENSCILWYKYYEYSEDWGLFLGHVPLHVVLIWPLFILGEHRYLRSLRSKSLDLPLTAVFKAVLCFVDTSLLANLIEIYCVSAKLWSWRESNCLGVPFIGILGWALFATPAVLVLTILEEQSRLQRFATDSPNRRSIHCSRFLPILCMAPVIVLHVGLFLLWFLGFSKLTMRRLSISGSIEAVGITVVQVFYYSGTKQLTPPRITDEIPRLLACGIVASLWLLKGHLDLGTCLVTAASLLRLLAFEF
eukprot:Skav218181  [mRNA]  locus=scaffold5213:202064:202945:- [translate_table: standard]